VVGKWDAVHDPEAYQGDKNYYFHVFLRLANGSVVTDRAALVWDGRTCPANEYFEFGICAACTVCESFQFEMAPCTATSNRMCQTTMEYSSLKNFGDLLNAFRPAGHDFVTGGSQLANKDHCQWPGITCNATSRRVVSIEIVGGDAFAGADLPPINLSPFTAAESIVLLGFGFKAVSPLDFGLAASPSLRRLVISDSTVRGTLDTFAARASFPRLEYLNLKCAWDVWSGGLSLLLWKLGCFYYILFYFICFLTHFLVFF
jgi:hypothetical protein